MQGINETPSKVYRSEYPLPPRILPRVSNKDDSGQFTDSL